MNEFEKTWIDSFKNYAVDIALIYKNHPVQILNCLGFKSVVGCLNETYMALVRTKELKPIEMLDIQTKNELWKKSKEYSTNKSQCELICRSIYLLNELTK
jgi:3'-phosphoadenosine 5'-phosphosulfate (PAPS) 3'-phosphatase